MVGRNWDPGNRGGDLFIRREDPIESGKRGFGKGSNHLEFRFWSYLWGIRATLSRWKDLLDWISNGKRVLVLLGDIIRSWISRVWKLLEGLWELIKISLFSDWLRALREEICQINQIILSLIGLILWLGNEELQFCYKRKGVLEVSIIHSTFLFFTLSLNFGDSGDFGLRLEMSQSQLIGKSGVLGSRENTRKRLKISVPHFDNKDLIKQYDKTLIGRCLNPGAQDVKALIVMLPKIWKVEERVAGTDLGFGRLQFDFVEEEDIETVLKAQPFHFDYWMIALARWQPKMPRNFPSAIPFWIKVLGVPLEFLDASSFQSIGDALGETEEVDLDYGRIKVVIDVGKGMSFDTTVDFVGGEFHEGDEAFISLKYEKLFGFCDHCVSLSHGLDECPLITRNPQKKKDVRELPISRQDDHARSYKGVVINGAMDQQGQGRDNRDHTGKGKGKMYEEPESRWVKVPEKRGNRGNNAEEKPSLQRELRRGISPRVGETREVPEEGEIPRQEERQSRGQGQEKPRESVVDSTVILASVQKVEVSNEQVQEELPEVKEDEEINEETEGKEQPPGEVEKKKVVRKGLFKQTAVAGASSKARNIQAIISTRKRATSNTKPATRQGEGAKHHEEKGPSYPTTTSSKP
ncbi:hypothetical protein Bca4012_092287 [Brassica carinata]